MKLSQLEAFREVVRAGSFRRAAGALFLSHPALTERIKRLEVDLGHSLFVRSGKGVHLTSTGRAFLPYVERTLEMQRQGREAIRAVTPVSAEVLRIAATPTAVAYFLPDVLARLQRETPAELHVESARTVHALRMVLKQDADVGIIRVAPARAAALSHPETEAVTLYEETAVLVCHPAHRFALRSGVGLAEVVQEPLVLYAGSSFYSLVETVCEELGTTPEFRMKLDGIEGAKRMVQRGLGLSFIPWTAVRREVASGSLRRVALAEGREPITTVMALVKRNLPLNAATCAFLNVLLEEASALT